MTKLLLAAVMYSPNLGDGVIAECIRAAGGTAEISSLDLAGRHTYPTHENPLRKRILSVLATLPAPLSERIARQLVTAQITRKLAPNTTTQLNGQDGVLIGGGQLLSDANLNFPLKIHHVVRAAEVRGLAFGIHSVGVTRTWSPAAQKLFGQVLGSPNLKFLSVRDHASRDNLIAHLDTLGLAHLPPPKVFPDPGFLSAPLLAPERAATAQTEIAHIGLGVTHPTALATHGETGTARHWPKWYASTARALVRMGYRVTLFTNGAFEDEDCLNRTFPTLTDIDPSQCTRAARPNSPAALVHLISTFDAVISHRLHANIIAYSCGAVPIGLPWDRKLEGFFNLINRTANLMQESQPSPQSLTHPDILRAPDMAQAAKINTQVTNGITAAIASLGTKNPTSQ
ncbi:polysaccharide pyruvyl transferase family protein (plasmid) [Falsihalocynthiibacter sp. SS001]|uniref:polysaccharide pyruvyl transferase family protein n=1 Tax=Falsihalocynthiibacter sp. SS001 TaxID=3349698 RepID=UPI0036D3D97B